jgi:hypothetical protein
MASSIQGGTRRGSVRRSTPSAEEGWTGAAASVTDVGAPSRPEPRGADDASRAAGRRIAINVPAFQTVVSAGMTLAAVALWIASIPSIDPSRISDIGLVTALPAGYIVAAMILSGGFALALVHRRLPPWLLGLDLVLFAVILHSAPAWVQEVPRFSTTYVHTGFAEAIMRTGHLFVNSDARFSWPVFFVLAAFVTSVAGLDNALPLTGWIPVISNLLYLLPLFMIYRALTVDRRVVWLGMWVFVVANWVGQDYFSPQGFNILLYLTVLAIVLTWFRSHDRPPLEGPARRVRRFIRSPWADGAGASEDVPEVSARPAVRSALVVVLVLIAAIVVSSHQLTPFAVLAGTTILVATRTTILRGLPILVGVLLGAWLSYMTLAYLAGHINALLSEALKAEAVASAAVGDRLRGNPGHIFIVYERIVLSAGFWGLAFLGGLRRLWNGHWDLPAALLAGFPFGFLALQSYGGEMLLRVYLFALPFMAFFVAGLILPRLRPSSRFVPLAVTGLSCVLFIAFLLARFGNDRADAMTADEVAAVDRADAYMPRGSVVVSSNHNSPLGYKDYDLFERFVGTGFVEFDLDGIAKAIQDRAGDRRAFIFLADSQRAFFDLNGFPGEQYDELVAELKASPHFRLVFQTRDTLLFELVRSFGST